MSLFKHTYSGLITKGLGMPACCGLITLGFHLFVCKIEVIIPVQPSRPMYPGKLGPNRRSKAEDDDEPKKRIRITVKFKDADRFIREYEVDDRRANITIKVINIINSISKRLSVGVNHVRNAARRVTAVFSPRDK